MTASEGTLLEVDTRVGLTSGVMGVAVAASGEANSIRCNAEPSNDSVAEWTSPADPPDH